MPFALHLILWFILIGPVNGSAKLKIYHCLSESGQIVIQDRTCRITDLFANSDQYKKKSLKANSNEVKRQKPQTHKYAPQLNTFQSSKLKSPAPEQFIQQLNSKIWQSQFFALNHGWQIAFSSYGVLKSNSRDADILISFYPDTLSAFGQDAFAQALDFYQVIRTDYLLQDSQFVSHPHFKVFNVSYRVAGERAYTEYFIAKNRPELWIVTVKASAKDWLHIWPDFIKIKSIL